MSSMIISIVIEDWIKSLFLINIIISEEKTSSLNISILINTDYWLTAIINY